VEERAAPDGRLSFDHRSTGGEHPTASPIAGEGTIARRRTGDTRCRPKSTRDRSGDDRRRGSPGSPATSANTIAVLLVKLAKTGRGRQSRPRLPAAQRREQNHELSRRATPRAASPDAENPRVAGPHSDQDWPRVQAFRP
jgi:hypothetical protein